MTRTRRLARVALRILIPVAAAGVVCAAILAGYVAMSRRTPLALPVPTGPFAVGRTLCDWVDTNRIDPLADQAGTPRQLAIWIWYPAEAGSQAAPAPYLPPAWAKARAQQGIGILDHDPAFIQTHSWADAPLSTQQATYPVLIMEPGMGPAIPDYTSLGEELASHGYIVVAINPTDTSFVVVFSDGRAVVRSATGAIPDNADLATAEQDADRIGAVWADDVIFAMDQLEDVNADRSSPFYGRLDLAHMGVFGHSFGGATALAVCSRDARPRAGVDIDGTPLSDAQQQPVHRPFMFLVEDWGNTCDHNCEAIRQAYDSVDSGAAYLVSVAGTKHFSFSDLLLRQVPVAHPFFALAGLSGSEPAERALEVTNAYLVAFFDKYLKDVDSPLLVGPTEGYPEVQFSSQ